MIKQRSTFAAISIRPIAREVDQKIFVQLSHWTAGDAPGRLQVYIQCSNFYFSHSSGPRPDWDPDIVATLDDDYEHCDTLDDDFVGVANASDPSKDKPHPPNQ